ncbi:MAG TPA: FixH family protein [Bacteroidia bacterium]
MSWGIKISIVYIGFVLLIVGMVLVSFNNKSELVTKDYYMQELNYQQRIDAIHNEKSLEETVTYQVTSEGISFAIPKVENSKKIEGEILLFRPSDSSKDITVKISPDTNGVQKINKSLLSKGIYKMSITWKNNNLSYYKEEVITI